MSGAADRRAAVFVDRDGTLIVEKEYLADPAGVELIDGAAVGLARLAAAGFALVLVSNQSGIARGLYGEAEYRAVQERLEALLAREGVRLDASYHCPHHPDFTGGCACRKPGLALFERAIEDLGLDAARSWFVGDRLRDVEPARALGGRGLLVTTGHGAGEVAAAGADVIVMPDLGRAADRILHDADAAGNR